jgi:hypothetical protein
MKTIEIEIYEEKMNFTASQWTEEEAWYITNSDFATIFYGAENQKLEIMEYLEEEIEDAMFLTDDNGTMIFFSNEELTVEDKEFIEFEIELDTFDMFTGTSGIYTIIDLDAE